MAHEVGGHHDAWNEIVAKVGTGQAWTDYYDLDYFGEKWAEARYQALKGTARDFTLTGGQGDLPRLRRPGRARLHRVTT